MLLAIDSATTLSGVALYANDVPLAEICWESGRNHSAQLLPQIDLLLRHVGAVQSDLTAIAVALGPGSWSGLRVGLSLAKGMALAGDLPLIGVSSLEALAYQHMPAAAPLFPLIQLGRDRFAVAEFRGRERLERRTPDQNLSLVDLIGLPRERGFFCGDLSAATRTALREGLANRAILPAPSANLRRPAFMAELAWQRFKSGQLDDLATLEPIYLGEPVKPKQG
ncbi:MAG: tRNA (adenosine(37)-N6)-threonylcarbamoyltransferase complex dimerization subunit type 1 TsaB [Oscillochloris sp.]|nr:tRNA (adenosine(37)-N6)-threonylcarbamoyltransferase complex dimerization subunit type 1 TsaB [Oscillochloris sp.]